MSYILDALKKIEQEKNKKAAPAGRINISGDLFNERTRPKSTASRWKVVALIVIASLVTGAGTWLMLRGGGKRRAHSSRPVVSHSATPVMPAPAPAAPVRIPQTPDVVVPVAPPAAPVRPEAKVANTEKAAVSALPVQPKKTPKSQRAATPPTPVAQTIQAPADIKLSGIAWQEDRAARRAVINGFLLKEGSVVAGAKITGIQSDSVRFSSAAGTFEIRLNSVVPGEGQK